MSSDEDEVRAATMRFYSAIENMISGKGLDLMQEVWHHTPQVTSGHPSGDWAEGWEETWATWKVFASFGRADRGGSQVHALRVYIYGDVAYTTCVYASPLALGGDRLCCTNVLHRMDGVWKIIHHHADKSPGMEAALEKMALEG